MFILKSVTINIYGKASAAVTEFLRNNLERYALTTGKRGVCVPQVMDANAADASAFGKALEGSLDIVGVNRCASNGHEHPIALWRDPKASEICLEPRLVRSKYLR